MVIKFRAWNYERNMMVKVTNIDLDHDGILINSDDLNDNTGGWVKPDGGLILMQYTGLKDKNGKEIYEGDVIIPDRAPYCQGVEDGQKVVVEWLECGSWYPFADNEDGMIYPNPKLSVVVGNIYENPELGMP